jgi:hypothetical protein
VPFSEPYESSPHIHTPFLLCFPSTPRSSELSTPIISLPIRFTVEPAKSPRHEYVWGVEVFFHALTSSLGGDGWLYRRGKSPFSHCIGDWVVTGHSGGEEKRVFTCRGSIPGHPDFIQTESTQNQIRSCLHGLIIIIKEVKKRSQVPECWYKAMSAIHHFTSSWFSVLVPLCTCPPLIRSAIR